MRVTTAANTQMVSAAAEQPQKAKRMPRKEIKKHMIDHIMESGITDQRNKFAEMTALFNKECSASQKDQLIAKMKTQHGIEEAYTEKMLEFYPNMKRRAVIQPKVEDHTLVAGQTINVSMEVKNNTKKTWKDDCTLTLDTKLSTADCPLEEICVPVQALGAYTTGYFTAPITVKANAARSNQVYDIYLCFKNGKGKCFGERFPMKIRI